MSVPALRTVPSGVFEPTSRDHIVYMAEFFSE
jgi:hypothetical protein